MPLGVSHACSSLGRGSHLPGWVNNTDVVWVRISQGRVKAGGRRMDRLHLPLRLRPPSSRAGVGPRCRAGRAGGSRGGRVLVISPWPGLLVGISSGSPSLLSSPGAGVTCALVTSEVCGCTPKPSLILSLCI